MQVGTVERHRHLAHALFKGKLFEKHMSGHKPLLARRQVMCLWEYNVPGGGWFNRRKMVEPEEEGHV